MTAMVIPSAGAPSTLLFNWNTIDWKKVIAYVRRLQMRIEKAFREGKHSKAKALQWILTHSFYAKLLAVRRVVQNQGAKTPGVDNITWNTSIQKMKAAMSLKRQGYQTKPLKRIYIPKKQNGEFRPLSIPAMQCRAQQALYLLSLEPIAESIADKNAYGFRPLRSAADAIAQCFIMLARKGSAQYILEGDIRSCFDSISHRWILENTPMDKLMLKKWLAAGYIEKNEFHPTELGTPQGGIISPTLLNVTLSGLENAVKSATKLSDKIHISIYADDFVITGASREILENKVKPAVETFLKERGLSLSQNKTKITHINEGFDFLGMNIRKYGSKLIIKPAKSSVKRLLADIRKTIKSNATTKTEYLLNQLNPKIRGWANYYRHVCAKKAFKYIDCNIFKAIWNWAINRHPNKGRKWVRCKYFRNDKFRNWVFFTKVKRKDGVSINVDLVEMSRTPIKRHIKVKAEATPFDSSYHNYFDKRISERESVKSSSKKKPKWWLQWWNLLKPDDKDRKVRVATTAAL
ncbi:group II intron reverse transcriptase/maturase [Aquicella lusitana]|uniref:RNA-directed DNA polymerase n=1 Tax=Aquicella lusitana TaxID=254246 RepID=A0A370GD75_9COXI|nr:group II intron reverse transcriptase/maturase [Aquicella lusitana]RDI41146.1 RNA-directed DNA polymerase [Aquicella lusitana]VVC74669.1 Group II intron-encoded protein LtrA [Aquicella lusitana]